MGQTNKPVDVFKRVNMHDGDKDVCWEWKGKLNKKDGRPYFRVDGLAKAAYVYSLELFSGEPSDGRHALHSCDNEVCCNPHHLRWGSHDDNMADMKERDRAGVNKVVRAAIRELLTEGKSHREIAKLYGLSKGTIGNIQAEARKEDND